MKKIRKLLPFPIYDIAGIEHWLEEQANAGLFPVFFNSWITFTPTGSPGTCFRLVLKDRKENEISPAQLALFEKAGWHYACSVYRNYALFYTTDPEAAEIISDWESRGFSFTPLKKQIVFYWCRTCIPYFILAVAVIWALFFFVSNYDVQPDHTTHLTLLLLHLFRPAALLLSVAAILLWRQHLREWKLLHRIQKTMAPPPAKDPSKAMVREQMLLIALLPLLTVSLIISYFDGLNPWNNIPIEQFSKPYISIQAIEQEPVLPWEDIFEEEPPGGTLENYVEKKISLLAPIWYDVTQAAYSPQSGSKPNHLSPRPENGMERYAPDLEATYFSLLLPALSHPVAEAQLDAYRLVNLQWHYAELSYPGLDFAIYATEPDGIWQMLAIGKENRVAVFRYAGREQLSEQLQLLSEAVN